MRSSGDERISTHRHRKRGKGEKEKRSKGDRPLPLCPFSPLLLFEGGWAANPKSEIRNPKSDLVGGCSGG
jgi:hypothetical protein